MSERKLQKYLQFKINTDNGRAIFLNLDGKELPDYKCKLTSSQWAKASKYLNRKLIPFFGYEYTVKDGHEDKIITII